MRTGLSIAVVCLILLTTTVSGQQVPQAQGPQSQPQDGSAPTLTPPTRDAQAVQLLNAVFAAMGGAQKASIADITVEGTLALPTAPSVSIGTFIAKARGFDFSMETGLNGHQTIFSVLSDKGSVLVDGKLKHLLPYNTEGLSLDLVPLFSRWSDYSQTVSTVQPISQSTANGSLVYVVHVEVPITRSSPFDNSQGKIDVSIDPSTSLVSSTEYQATEGRFADQKVSARTEYSEYKKFGNIVLPTTATRILQGSPLIVYHVSTVVFNVGLTDSDFQNQGSVQ